jgi:hypothetical protein
MKKIQNSKQDLLQIEYIILGFVLGFELAILDLFRI